VIELREIVGGDDRRRLRAVHLEHHAIEAAGLVRMLREPIEERGALERFEGGALIDERVIEMRPHVGEIVVEEHRRRSGVVGRMGTEQPPKRREHEAPAGRLGHDPKRRERAQQPIDAVGNEAARRGNRGVVFDAVLHHVGKTEPRESSNRAGHPQAAQQLQHFLVQQRRIDVGGLVALAVHDPVPQNIVPRRRPNRWAAAPRITQFKERG
jgi:hypothetical protein